MRTAFSSAALVVVLLHARLLAAEEGPPPLPPSPLPLEWCLERADAVNPDIASASADAEAARHRIDPAGSLEDPRFSYELVNVPRDERDLDSTPMSGQQLRLGQKIPFPGLLGNREEAARAAAEAANERLADRTYRIAAAVESAWVGLGFDQRALAITDSNIDLLRQLSRIAEAKYRVGTGLQQDVLRAQVALTELLQEKLLREEDIRESEASLARLLDLPPATSLTRTEDLAEAATLPALQSLVDRLEQASPLLRSLDARIEEAERQERVAVLEGYPDFDFGFGYRIRQRAAGDSVPGEDFLSAGVTIRLPINRRKWRERIAERQSLVRRAKAEYRGSRASLRDALRASFANLERADAEVDLLESGLVPQARQSLASSRSGYQVDKVDFLSLIDSQVSLLDAELRLVRAIADRRAGFAAVEAVLGERIR